MCRDESNRPIPGSLSFVAETETGHSVSVDSAPEFGGRNSGPRPMELVLVGLGSCSGIDIMTILRKMREDVVDCEIELQAERAESVPRVFTRIHMHYRVSGRNLSDKNVKRAVELSAQKYCSVTRMLEPTVVISHDYEVHKTDY